MSFTRLIYWPFVQSIKNQFAANALKELNKSQWSNQTKLLSNQWELVTQTVRKAAREVPFYRERYQRINWNLENTNFTYNDFLKLPPIHKEEVRDHIKEFLNPNYKGRITQGSTSGSTGQGLKLFYSCQHESYSEAARWRGKSWWGVDIGRPQVTFWGRPYTGFVNRISQKAKSYLMNTLLFSGFELQERSLARFWKKISHFRPSIIYGYPTAIYTLAAYLKKNDIATDHLDIKVIMTPGETITSNQRASIEEVFRCKTANEYGCSETGGFVYECPEGGWHISTELTFVEFLDAQGTPVSPGQTGGVYITHLRNEYMPLIRYAVGDIGGPLKGVCRCGRGLPLMNVSVAKESDVFRVSSGEKYSAKIFDYINMAVIKMYPSSIVQFRVFQREFDNFDIEVMIGSDHSGRGETLFSELTKKQLGQNVSVNIKRVPQIMRESTGKLRYFISEVG